MHLDLEPATSAGGYKLGACSRTLGGLRALGFMCWGSLFSPRTALCIPKFSENFVQAASSIGFGE